MTGASYMGISQIFAAAGKPKGLKAIFPQVPGADVYRDVVASGGQLDVGFIPLWLGLVTATGLIPPAVGATDPESGFERDRRPPDRVGDHVHGPLLLKAIAGGEPAYDGPFYRERSPDQRRSTRSTCRRSSSAASSTSSSAARPCCSSNLQSGASRPR